MLQPGPLERQWEVSPILSRIWDGLVALKDLHDFPICVAEKVAHFHLNRMIHGSQCPGRDASIDPALRIEAHHISRTFGFQWPPPKFGLRIFVERWLPDAQMAGMWLGWTATNVIFGILHMPQLPVIHWKIMADLPQNDKPAMPTCLDGFRLCWPEAWFLARTSLDWPGCRCGGCGAGGAAAGGASDTGRCRCRPRAHCTQLASELAAAATEIGQTLGRWPETFLFNYLGWWKFQHLTVCNMRHVTWPYMTIFLYFCVCFWKRFMGRTWQQTNTIAAFGGPIALTDDKGKYMRIFGIRWTIWLLTLSLSNM